jgi:hypothetical protein
VDGRGVEPGFESWSICWFWKLGRMITDF